MTVDSWTTDGTNVLGLDGTSGSVRVRSRTSNQRRRVPRNRHRDRCRADGPGRMAPRSGVGADGEDIQLVDGREGVNSLFIHEDALMWTEAGRNGGGLHGVPLAGGAARQWSVRSIFHLRCRCGAARLVRMARFGSSSDSRSNGHIARCSAGLLSRMRHCDAQPIHFHVAANSHSQTTALCGSSVWNRRLKTDNLRVCRRAHRTDWILVEREYCLDHERATGRLPSTCPEVPFSESGSKTSASA